jgi:hypothetical protein
MTYEEKIERWRKLGLLEEPTQVVLVRSRPWPELFQAQMDGSVFDDAKVINVAPKPEQKP